MNYLRRAATNAQPSRRHLLFSLIALIAFVLIHPWKEVDAMSQSETKEYVSFRVLGSGQLHNGSNPARRIPSAWQRFERGEVFVVSHHAIWQRLSADLVFCDLVK